MRITSGSRQSPITPCSVRYSNRRDLAYIRREAIPLQVIRSAVVMVNAPIALQRRRELGLGAEIGISATRPHAYRPMGVESLTVVHGVGQVRHSSSRGSGG